MDHAHAALAVVKGFCEKCREQLAGLVSVKAVQVDFSLDDPAAPPQVTQYALRQPAAQVERLVPAFEPVLQVDSAMQAFMKRGLFVSEVLERARGWWAAAVPNAAVVRQRPGIRHGRMKGGEIVRVDQACPRLSR